MGCEPGVRKHTSILHTDLLLRTGSNNITSPVSCVRGEKREDLKSRKFHMKDCKKLLTPLEYKQIHSSEQLKPEGHAPGSEDLILGRPDEL